jgi:hypothetical protein
MLGSEKETFAKNNKQGNKRLQLQNRKKYRTIVKEIRLQLTRVM